MSFVKETIQLSCRKRKKGKDMLKKIAGKVVKICSKIKWGMKDFFWYIKGGNFESMFSPSFYHTHTKEEILEIKKAEMDKLWARLEQYCAETNQ